MKFGVNSCKGIAIFLFRNRKIRKVQCCKHNTLCSTTLYASSMKSTKEYPNLFRRMVK